MSQASDSTPAALVTGASSGIGRAVAVSLAGLGFDLTLAGRDENRLAAVAEEASDAGGRVQTVAVDLGRPDGAEQAVEAHRSRFTRLDCVVANAGAGRRAAVAATERDALRRLLAVHVESAFALARCALPMLRRPPGATPTWFVATASVSGLLPTAGFAGYSAAKSALVSLTASINAEESRNGVRACALCPGFVDTPMTAPVQDAVAPDAMLRPEDVARSVLYLLSLSPSAVVGQLVIQRVGTAPFEP